MNKYYNYKNLELWYGDKWQDKISRINGLVQWMGENKPINENEYPHREITGNPTEDKYYFAKTLSINEPEIVKYWKDKGIRLSVLSQGGKRWVSMVPEKAIADRENSKLPALIVFHKEHYSDPWWAMRTVEFYKEYNEYLAAHPDFMIIYLVTEGPDVDRIYLNIIQEAFVLYPTDLHHVYLDVRHVIKHPTEDVKKLSDIKDFYYTDTEGNPANPDDYIEPFGPCPYAINVSYRWDNRDSLTRGLIMEYAMNEGRSDREWLIHTETGKKFMEGIALEYQFNTVNDKGYAEYWDAMGLKFDIHFYKGERWLSMVPKCAFDEPEKKLPVILVLQEVYEGNEHLAVTASSYFYQSCEIAAQGECILLYFVMEDNDSNDLFVDILEEAKTMYPIDATRVYATGHSHDGFFTLEFYRRHRDIIAAAATLGDSNGLIDPVRAGESNFFPNQEKLDIMHKSEMPLINLTGRGEGCADLPKDEKTLTNHVDYWQRRLYASNCPMKTREEIIDAMENGDTVERELGLPVDHSEVLWAEGFRHYVADIKNVDGKNWLRLVCSENMPHTTNPFMLNMMWSFCRRFARDLETGKTIELY